MAHDYQPALGTATQAALDAGALLLREFLKPGGPTATNPQHAPADHARADTRLTHPNPVCQDASAYLVSLAGVIREGLSPEAAYDRACAWHAEHGVSHTVAAALAAARHAPPQYERSQGHVLIALQNAFYQALHAASVEDGLVATVMAGGDTDTNAAIAGALLGALHGARALPHQWRQAVLTCRPQAGAPGVQRPRPRTYWPVDALIVAERLLLAGKEAAAHAT